MAESHVHFALQLAPELYFYYGKTDSAIESISVLSVDGAPLAGLFCSKKIASDYTALLFHSEQSYPSLEIATKEKKFIWDAKNAGRAIEPYVSMLSADDAAQLFQFFLSASARFTLKAEILLTLLRSLEESFPLFRQQVDAVLPMSDVLYYFQCEKTLQPSLPNVSKAALCMTQDGALSEGKVELYYDEQTGWLHGLVSLKTSPSSALEKIILPNGDAAIIVNISQDQLCTEEYILGRFRHQANANLSHLCAWLSRGILSTYAGAKPAPLLNTMQLLLPFQSTKSTSQKDVPFDLSVETLVPIGEQGIFIAGTLRDPHQQLKECTLVSALGFSLQCKKYIHYVGGAAKGAESFVAYIPLPEELISHISGKASLIRFDLSIESCDGVALNIAPQYNHYAEEEKSDVIRHLFSQHNISSTVFKEVVTPCFSALQNVRAGKSKIQHVFTFEKQPNSPVTSVIIPLYRYYECIPLQYASFSHDPDFAEGKVELIYVLDEPEDAERVKKMLSCYSFFYDVPVKLIINRANYGYATSINHGVRYARAEYVLLYNSDMFPASTGWLSEMYRTLNASKNTAIVGAKLLRTDDSIQHAGIAFRYASDKGYFGIHCYEGMPRSYKPASKSRKLQAVTGACQLMPIALFREWGGLSTDYMIGDCEDMELCLKATQAGYAVRYSAKAELYHLQRHSLALHQGYSDLVGRYNVSLFNQRWKAVISDILKEEGENRAA